ncbi:MAG: 2-amino-4-hydroxy-6-hydroxymethyldihydropteridine diphosphokinase [Bryobacterales bacterium]|nr:2-amino-4-hydroxy-6-hydroxymethyldihydropteridine diphosphokinase [Bryobacterales bacterium]
MTAVREGQGDRVHLGLGSNVGDKVAHLREAAMRLTAVGNLEGLSSLYRTEPVGFADQDWFLNAAICLRTALSPPALLQAALAIERDMGRIRTVRNGPRSIDIDLLLWEDSSSSTSPDSRCPIPACISGFLCLRPWRRSPRNRIQPVAGQQYGDLFRDAMLPEGGVERYGDFPRLNSEAPLAKP